MPPLMCNYYLTYKCNSRCTYCDIPVNPSNRKVKEAAAELVIENMVALRRLGVKIIDFTGGEPLLYPHLPRVLAAAKELGFFVSLANSGTLYSHMAREIKGLVDDLKFSLSTTEPSAYHKERGIDGFDKVIASIELAQSIGEKPSIIATATPTSIFSMEAVVKLAQRLNVPVLLGPVFDCCGNELLQQQGLKELDRLSKLANVCVNWAFLEFFRDGGNSNKKPRCRAISSTIVVSPDDRLLLPCYHAHNERLQIVHKDGRSNLDDLWRSEQVQHKRALEGTWEFCQGCTLWCYFETSFLWPPDKYFWLNLKSKGRWLIERTKQQLRARSAPSQATQQQTASEVAAAESVTR